MLLMISAITFNAWAEDSFHEEWRRVNKELNMDELMKGQDSNGNVIDLRNQAKQGINPEVLGSSEAETTNVERSIKDKRPQELQAQGREAMHQNQEVTNLMGDLQQNVDRTQPDVNSIFKKAYKIGAKRASMDDNLSQYLKEKYGIDIGCTSTLGKQDAIDTPFIMGEEVQEIRNETYEPQYCEHLLNTYACTTDLHINCLKPGNHSLQLDIKEANFGYSQEGNLIHFDHVYGNSGHASKVKKVHYTFHHLGISELRLVFEIPNVEALDALTLTGINFSHALFIQFNNHNVYPSNWTDLKVQIRESHFFWGRAIRQVGPAYHEVLNRHYRSMSYYDQYPRLDYGTGSLVVNVDTRGNNHIDNIDLTRFVRPGHNELIIKGGSIGHNYIRATLRSMQKTCLKWSEKWVETCVLQPS